MYRVVVVSTLEINKYKFRSKSFISTLFNKYNCQAGSKLSNKAPIKNYTGF